MYKEYFIEKERKMYQFTCSFIKLNLEGIISLKAKQFHSTSFYIKPTKLSSVSPLNVRIYYQ